MKLFTRKEIQEERNKALDSLRAKEASVVKSLNQKTKELDDALPILEARLKEKQEELAQAENEVKRLKSNSLSELLVLEERRKKALEPIEAERERNAAEKLQVASMLLRFGEQQMEMMRVEEAQRKEKARLEAKSISLETYRLQSEQALAEQKAKADETSRSAKECIAELQEEARQQAKTKEEIEEKTKASLRAELTVKGMMLALDERLKLEKEEQKKTDSKRMTLKIAIDEIKKRGLWNKALEKKIE